METKQTLTVPRRTEQSSRDPKSLQGQSNTHHTAHNSGARPVKIAPLAVPAVETGKGGGALRSIDSKFQVNPSNGTCSFSIPIHITPTRNNFQPSLNLNYDSGSGNGPFGVGWSLSSGQVWRKTSQRIPTYGDTDTFVLSGMDDLVRLTAPETVRGGYLVQRFRPRVEDNAMRIERWTNQDDRDDIHWRTTSPTNVTSIYGRTKESRVFESVLPNTENIFSWLLCESYDAFGNAIIYTYKPENLDNTIHPTSSLQTEESVLISRDAARARYLKSIKYGNIKPARDLESWSILPPGATHEWMFEVVLDYGEHDQLLPTTSFKGSWLARKDAFSSNISGFKVRYHRLCRRLMMFHHFAKELGVEDYLVRSTNFEYVEDPAGSRLISIVTNGHMLDATGTPWSESIAPLVFDYTPRVLPKDLVVGKKKPAGIQMIPTPGPKSSIRWIDLDGEGSPGLLVQIGRSWYYQRNKNAIAAEDDGDGHEVQSSLAEEFGGVKLLGLIANVDDHQAYSFGDLNGTGLQSVTTMDASGRFDGYYDYLGEDEWKVHKLFPSQLNYNMQQKSFLQIDLTGNGLNDLMIIEGNKGEITWHECLGKQGFGHLRKAQVPGLIPQLTAGDAGKAILLADMTGDGLTDLVYVSNRRISYWANLGYGRFDTEIVMANSPCLEENNEFDATRVHLLDTDGSGTADLVYILPSGGVVLHRNESGNSWTEGCLVASFPRVHNPSSVFSLDLLGKGTSCLCWVAADGSGNELAIFYLDLAPGPKPFLLKSFSNGTGLQSSISYAPSTKFYLRNERSGTPWRTKLPFPVHIVERVVEFDEISLTKLTTRYNYHDGFYDIHEREFRGFGMVESWETEELRLDSQRPYRTPVRYTKMWYLTGNHEIKLDAQQTFGVPKISTSVPLGLPFNDLRDVYRALNGKQVRVELYETDGSDEQHIPYYVTESNYEVETVQKWWSLECPGIHRTHLKENLSIHYERQSSHPRMEHNIVLERNEFGDTTKSLAINYGRDADDSLDPKTRKTQMAHSILLSETQYTTPLPESEDFFKPVQAVQRQFHILGLEVVGILDADAIRSEDFSKFPIRSIMSADAELEEKLLVNKEKVRIFDGENRVYYRSKDLREPLHLGSFEPLAIVDQTYELVLTRDVVLDVYGVDGSNVSSLAIDSVRKEGGYVDLDGDGNWWAPSSRSLFDTKGGELSEISAARNSFFLPTISQDPFGSVSKVKMDQYWMLPEAATDAVGNDVTATNDYRSMTATQITDSNANRMEVALDVFADVVAEAKMGKLEDEVAENVHDLDLAIPEETLLSFVRQPTYKVAKAFLGQAGSRSIHYRKYHKPGDSSRQILPPFSIDLVRTSYLANRSAAQNSSSEDISMSITYFNGSGFPIGSTTIASWKSKKDQWCHSGYVIPDSSGATVRAFHPFLSNSPAYMPAREFKLPSIIMLYDALGRDVYALKPDHTWTKTIRSAWSTQVWNDGNNIKVSNPTTDPNIGHRILSLDPTWILPSWKDKKLLGTTYDMQAARNSEIYASNPTVTYFDTSGHLLLTTSSDGAKKLFNAFQYDIRGNQIAETDSLGRQVELRRFDLEGNRIRVENMDTGVQLCLKDCTGNDLIVYNAGDGCTKHYIYDSLRRHIETRVRLKDDGKEISWLKIFYGENEKDAKKRNIRGQIARVCDQSGSRGMLRYDHKGNCLASTMQLCKEYKGTIDWSREVVLEDTVYTTETVFDAVDRPILSIDPHGKVIKRDFNVQGGLAKLASSTKLRVDASIKAVASNTAMIQWTHHITNVTYDARGNPTRIDRGNSTHTEYTYDELTSAVVNKRTWREDGKTLEDITYTYDIMGRISHTENDAHSDIYFRNQKIRPAKDYQYDAFGRLIKATGREMVDPVTSASRSLGQTGSSLRFVTARSEGLPANGAQLARYTETYTYDDADNILSLRHDFDDSSIASRGWTYHYESRSQIESESSKMGNKLTRRTSGSIVETFTYDGDAGKMGCMTSMPTHSSFEWDVNQQMRSSAKQSVKSGAPETTWYVYNSEGRRIRKITERQSDSNDTGKPRKLNETIYLDSAEIFRTFQGKGDGNTIKKQKLTSLIRDNASDGNLVAISETELSLDGTGNQNATELIRYTLGESLEVDEKGQVISYEEYTPFGESTYILLGRGIEAPSKFRFASYTRDNETGFYLCGARYYCPWLGRWLSADPIGTDDSLNVFAYVGNDPVNSIDTTGTARKSYEMLEAENARLKAENKALTQTNAENEAGKVKAEKEVLDIKERVVKLENQVNEARDQGFVPSGPSTCWTHVKDVISHPVVTSAIGTAVATTINALVIPAADPSGSIDAFSNNHPWLWGVGDFVVHSTIWGGGWLYKYYKTSQAKRARLQEKEKLAKAAGGAQPKQEKSELKVEDLNDPDGSNVILDVNTSGVNDSAHGQSVTRGRVKVKNLPKGTGNSTGANFGKASENTRRRTVSKSPGEAGKTSTSKPKTKTGPTIKIKGRNSNSPNKNR